MHTPNQRFEERYLLIAEDDEDDRHLMRTAFAAKGFNEKLVFTENGEELLEYMYNAHEKKAIAPVFVLLDLNMPKKDGKETLRELKQHPELRKTPVVIFSTTNNQQVINKCYELGANSYILKPPVYESLLNVVDVLTNYWFSVVSKPS